MCIVILNVFKSYFFQFNSVSLKDWGLPQSFFVSKKALQKIPL